MAGTILVGVGREIRSEPDDAFLQSIKGLPARMASRLAFMTSRHHLVRDFVVREMPRQRKPITPVGIAKVIGLEFAEVSSILAQLERNLFFLVRDSEGSVAWAFPVTTSVTPHKLSFSTDENIFGA
jgi:hypothetical protein